MPGKHAKINAYSQFTQHAFELRNRSPIKIHQIFISPIF